MAQICGYEVPYWGVCKQPKPCKDHAGLKCRKCGDPATHACPTMTSFLCGTPLCMKHKQCCRQ